MSARERASECVCVCERACLYVCVCVQARAYVCVCCLGKEQQRPWQRKSARLPCVLWSAGTDAPKAYARTRTQDTRTRLFAHEPPLMMGGRCHTLRNAASRQTRAAMRTRKVGTPERRLLATLRHEAGILRDTDATASGSVCQQHQRSSSPALWPPTFLAAPAARTLRRRAERGRRRRVRRRARPHCDCNHGTCNPARSTPHAVCHAAAHMSSGRQPGVAWVWTGSLSARRRRRNSGHARRRRNSSSWILLSKACSGRCSRPWACACVCVPRMPSSCPRARGARRRLPCLSCTGMSPGVERATASSCPTRSRSVDSAPPFLCALVCEACSCEQPHACHRTRRTCRRGSNTSGQVAP